MQNKPLHGMFTAVPLYYDRINRVVTWGMDRKWRNEAAAECVSARPEKVLDLCCGTGDLTISIALLAGKEVEVSGVDYSLPMLEIATEKVKHLAEGKKITLVHGDASNLPFPSGHFDCIGISFAFRNLTYRNPLVQCHLAEVLRVLKPGGRFVIVETSQPDFKLIRRCFHFYLRWFAFRLGYFLSANRGAYQYLAESASQFYTHEGLKEMLLKAGFGQVNYRQLFLGVVAIHIAVK